MPMPHELRAGAKVADWQRGSRRFAGQRPRGVPDYKTGRRGPRKRSSPDEDTRVSSSASIGLDRGPRSGPRDRPRRRQRRQVVAPAGPFRDPDQDRDYPFTTLRPVPALTGRWRPLQLVDIPGYPRRLDDRGGGRALLGVLDRPTRSLLLPRRRGPAELEAFRPSCRRPCREAAFGRQRQGDAPLTLRRASALGRRSADRSAAAEALTLLPACA